MPPAVQAAVRATGAWNFIPSKTAAPSETCKLQANSRLTLYHMQAQLKALQSKDVQLKQQRRVMEDRRAVTTNCNPCIAYGCVQCLFVYPAMSARTGSQP